MPGGQVVAGAAVDVDAHALGLRAEAAAGEALARDSRRR